MPGMNRGGGMMPGQGGGGMPPQSGGNTMAGEMLGGMFGAAPQRFSGSPAPVRDAPWNNWGMGDAPPAMTPGMFALQERCLAGDGRACNQLQIAQASQQQAIAAFHTKANQRGQWHNARGTTSSPMRAR